MQTPLTDQVRRQWSWDLILFTLQTCLLDQQSETQRGFCLLTHCGPGRQGMGRQLAEPFCSITELRPTAPEDISNTLATRLQSKLPCGKDRYDSKLHTQAHTI